MSAVVFYMFGLVSMWINMLMMCHSAPIFVRTLNGNSAKNFTANLKAKQLIN